MVYRGLPTGIFIILTIYIFMNHRSLVTVQCGLIPSSEHTNIGVSKRQTSMVSNTAGERHRLPGPNRANNKHYIHFLPAAENIDFLIDDDDNIVGDIAKRQHFDDYGHMRFGKRGDAFDDYGHMRFGRKDLE